MQQRTDNHGSVTATATLETPVNTPYLLTAEQAAEYLGLPVVTLDLLRPLQVGPSAIRVGGRGCYRTAELDAWRARGDRRTELMAAIGVVVNRCTRCRCSSGRSPG